MADNARPASPPAGSRAVRRRPAPKAAGPMLAGRGGQGAGIFRDDSPGIKVDPIVVLVFSLVFIASVFVLHIVGRMLK
ncbi:hypothetical protein DFJ74DRAFT_679142 [Hyaloraphidium curvatum]|nr:hypothetical protein DFJ74DRAFT_679142 [Hyaloraphidium curvatum]